MKKRALIALGGIVVLTGLYLVSLHSYLLFHSLAEVFSIIVAGGIFMVAWNARKFLEQGYFLFLGIAFGFVAILDLVHTLAYPGMNIIPRADGDQGIQVWLAARYFHSISLFVAPIFLRRRLKPFLTLGAGASIAALLLASIFLWEVFPACYIEGQGLTLFKVANEYVICSLFLGALLFHWLRRKQFDQVVLWLLCSSMVLTIASELAFTLYVSPYGLANLIGHFLKILAFYLIYTALIQVVLAKPYEVLFRELKKSEAELRVNRHNLEAANEELRRSFQQLAEDETAARQIQFHLLPPACMTHCGCEFRSMIRTSTYLSGDFVDYFTIDRARVGFYIADVSGHGVSSAFITVLLKSTIGHLLEEYARQKDESILRPSAVLRALNEYIVQHQFDKYLTMFYGVLDLDCARLTFSNAGHFPCPILGEDNRARYLEHKNLPVGLFAHASFEQLEIPLPAAFRLALFSDGILDVLPHGSIKEKMEYLLTQARHGDITFDQLECNLGLQKIESPADDLTMLLVRKAA
jgi:serine phosphatase RsbU (regulator of sigma subunit)